MDCWTEVNMWYRAALINMREAQKCEVGSHGRIHAVRYHHQVKEQAELMLRNTCLCGKLFKNESKGIVTTVQEGGLPWGVHWQCQQFWKCFIFTAGCWVRGYFLTVLYVYICTYAYMYRINSCIPIILLKKKLCDIKAGSQWILLYWGRAWQVQGTGRRPVKLENSGQDEARDLGSFQASLTMLGSFEDKMFCLHPEALAEFWRIISMLETL